MWCCSKRTAGVSRLVSLSLSPAGLRRPFAQLLEGFRVKPRVFLPAIVSGVLLWLAYFPLNLGPLAFIALAPWLTLVRAPVSNKRRYFAAYVGGFVFFALATQWVRVAHPMMYLSWLGFSVLAPLFWLVALAIIRKLDRLGVPLALAVPVGWVALEYARMHFPTGYPFLKYVGAYQMIGFGWYFLGYTQHEFLRLIQIADVGGVYAVSFVVAAVNGLIADWLLLSPAVQRRLRWPVDVESRSPQLILTTTCLVALLLAGTYTYGHYQLQHEPFANGPLVAVLQGNLSQGDKMRNKELLVESYIDLHFKAIHWDKDRKAYTGGPKPDLVIWPETCCPVDWCDIAPGAKVEDAPDAFQRKRMTSRGEFLGKPWGTSTLLGLTGLEWDGNRVWKYNSAFLVKPLPKSELWKPDDPTLFYTAAVARYDKMHLVPFGEYVPLKEQLPFMKWFTPYDYDYSCRPGERWTRFPLVTRDGREFTFACLICYEDSDPYLARQYVATEPVNFLVNISNDGWFDGTEEHEQHLAICRFRAIETRRSVVRSVNMGISGVIDPDGRVIALPGETWRTSKKMEAVVTAAVPIDNRGSWYATLGDWMPFVCWSVVGLALVVGLVWRKPAPASS
ncbi:MAG: apolipoprotein N-acyltransferase [Planctomycetia bacterium]|nr:apolipoprotein N-acyltransferase [Planctomycetia bacterium]